MIADSINCDIDAAHKSSLNHDCGDSLSINNNNSFDNEYEGKHCNSVEIINTKTVISRNNKKFEVHQYKQDETQQAEDDNMMADDGDLDDSSDVSDRGGLQVKVQGEFKLLQQKNTQIEQEKVKQDKNHQNLTVKEN